MKTQTDDPLARWATTMGIGFQKDDEGFFRFMGGAKRLNREQALCFLEGYYAHLQKDLRHTHVAGTTVGLDIDTCALCGKDIRNDIHLQIGEKEETIK